MSNPQADRASRSKRVQRSYDPQYMESFKSAVSEHDDNPETQESRRLFPETETFNCTEYARQTGIPDRTIRNWLARLRKVRNGETGHEDIERNTETTSEIEGGEGDRDNRGNRGNNASRRKGAEMTSTSVDEEFQPRSVNSTGKKRQVNQYSALDLDNFELAVREYDQNPIMTQRGKIKAFNCAQYAKRSGIPERTVRDWLKELREGMSEATENYDAGSRSGDDSDSGAGITRDFDDFMSGSNGDQDYTEMMSELDHTMSIPTPSGYDSGVSSQAPQSSYSGYDMSEDMDLSLSIPTSEITEGYIPEYADGTDNTVMGLEGLAIEDYGQGGWGDPDVWYRLGEEAAGDVFPS